MNWIDENPEKVSKLLVCCALFFSIVFTIIWPVVYVAKYGFTRNGFKSAKSKTECSKGIYTTYKNCSALQKTGRALWDIYSTLYFVWIFILFIFGMVGGM